MDSLVNNQENKLGNGVSQLNVTYNDLINSIHINGNNISTANLVTRVSVLYMVFETLLKKIVTMFINFMSKTQNMLIIFDKTFTDFSNILTLLDKDNKERDTRLLNLEDNVNQMGLQFLPIIKERQELDNRRKESSMSMYSGGNKTGTRRRRSANKKRK